MTPFKLNKKTQIFATVPEFFWRLESFRTVPVLRKAPVPFEMWGATRPKIKCRVAVELHLITTP